MWILKCVFIRFVLLESNIDVCPWVANIRIRTPYPEPYLCVCVFWGVMDYYREGCRCIDSMKIEIFERVAKTMEIFI